jgi:hypothetical protein
MPNADNTLSLNGLRRAVNDANYPPHQNVHPVNHRPPESLPNVSIVPIDHVTARSPCSATAPLKARPATTWFALNFKVSSALAAGTGTAKLPII